MTYALLDSGHGQKLERFGPFTLARPASQAIWKPTLPKESWEGADALFTREEGNGWLLRKKLPDSWIVDVQGVRFKIAPTDFGHLGVFPEHSLLWQTIRQLVESRTEKPNILNLFAYSGGATLVAGRAGARVCHLDASKGMVSWARENAELNGLGAVPIRWIVDDVMKFLKREVKRGVRYDGIILDPPSFGRGNQGEVFKIERDLPPILEICFELLSPKPLFVILSSHTPGFTPLVLHHLLFQMMQGVVGHLECGELIIPSENGVNLPSGHFARWYAI
jgi:23S rRNA (cytosine1962-C5)-methyltransferase